MALFGPTLLIAAAVANAIVAFRASTMLAMTLHVAVMSLLFVAAVTAVTRIAEGRV